MIILGIDKTFLEIMNNYQEKIVSESFGRQSSMFKLINYQSRDEIKEILRNQGVAKAGLEVKASCGAGVWTRYPWIAIFNPKITSTIQEGVYIVYLFSTDMKRVYLTLNQGCTNLGKKVGTKAARMEMKKVREEIRAKVDGRGFLEDTNLKVGNQDYEEGCIFYKEYHIGRMVSETEIISDLNKMELIYDDYYSLKEHLTVDNGGGKPVESNKLETEINLIKHIEQYINGKGFIYSYDDLCNFYLSLKTKPFVILAGISGTGKSKLVKLFAEALSSTSENGRFCVISVKPDWNDSTELLGYKNINNEFIPGKLTELLVEAARSENRDKPYFVCLDEMNLARVEYYLSEYLSVIETRHFNESGSIVTDTLLKFERGTLKDSMVELTIPENVYIVGTVNMDDTTFAFSRKVLDRANTIEFSTVNLDMLDFLEQDLASVQVDNAMLKSSFINIKEALVQDKDYVKSVNQKILEINDILNVGSKQFGYRVRDEIVFYMLENKVQALLEHEMAFDYQIMQKVLPIITGSDSRIRDILIGLYNYCNPSGEISLDMDYIKLAEEGIATALYPKSAAKIVMMLRGYEDGYTSFWI